MSGVRGGVRVCEEWRVCVRACGVRTVPVVVVVVVVGTMVRVRACVCVCVCV